MKTDEQWLDKFVKMEEKWIKDAKGWEEYMEAKYPKVGNLDKWETEDPETWPELTEEEKEALNKCIIMWALLKLGPTHYSYTYTCCFVILVKLPNWT